MYKGYKVTKHLQRYMGYAKMKYEKKSIQGEVDLWEILREYNLFINQPRCIQLYIYDWVKEEVINGENYKIINSIDGCIYVKEIFKTVA